MRSLPIIYLDERLVAVNKPAGLLVHRSAIDRSETEYAMQILRDQLGRWVYPLHRLDKATSGALLFALDRDYAGIMTGIFSRGRVSKTYLAVVRGFTAEQGSIDHPLKVLQDRTTDHLAAPDKPAQEAVTDYERLATVEFPYPVGRYATARFSLIKAHPRTGRMHQLRRHMKHIFHPIIGDTTYGDGKQNEFFRRELGCRRLLLHSSEISFPHPATGHPVRILAHPEPDLRAFLLRLNWDRNITDLLMTSP
ncbi:MAG: pseudouridine synthase [Nitrospirota bacterium]|nr:pseudouridine synthase [Nitrospirota bacterium]